MRTRRSRWSPPGPQPGQRTEKQLLAVSTLTYAEHEVLPARRGITHRPCPRIGGPRPGERVRPVIHRTAPRVAEHFIGITHHPEPLRRSGAAAVRMARARGAPIGASNLLARRLPGHSQDDVRIPMLTARHPTSPLR